MHYVIFWFTDSHCRGTLLCVPAYAEAQYCFKSFALRSCQCSRKTLYGLKVWSLDLPSAQVYFLGRVPALSVTVHYVCSFILISSFLIYQGNLRSWLQDPDCYDQFSVIYDGGEKTAIFANNSSEPAVVEERAVSIAIIMSLPSPSPL